jgi:hypothetical protein
MTSLENNAPSKPGIKQLERIMFCRNHFVVSAKYVSPLYLIWLDQIHRTDGSPQAIPSKPDLI